MTELDDTLYAQQQVVRLHALLEASRLIHSTIVRDEVLHIVLQIVVRELKSRGRFSAIFPSPTVRCLEDFKNPCRELERDDSQTILRKTYG